MSAAMLEHAPAMDLNTQYLELAELAGRLIHEIKNHLGTLGLNLQLLAEDFQNPETPRERRAGQRVQRMLTECQRLTDLSNDFLRFARVRDLHLTPTRLQDLVEEMVDFHRPSLDQAGIEIRPYLPADLPVVTLDQEMIKQAILNLMLNAAQAMPDGGQLTIQAEHDDQEIRLNFIDTGVGMTPEVQARIFRPFFTTRPGGSGLGLATTRKFIEAHGGRITVQSEPGKGTKFTLHLSLNPAAAALNGKAGDPLEGAGTA
jgi:signal transduction histidine kinase